MNVVASRIAGGVFTAASAIGVAGSMQYASDAITRTDQPAEKRVLSGALALAGGYGTWQVANYAADLLHVKNPRAVVIATLVGGGLLGAASLALQASRS